MSKLINSVYAKGADSIALIASTYATNRDAFVADMLKTTNDLYRKVATRLHHTACVVLYHAAETGDNRPLNTFFNGLRQNDRDALRVWVGKAASYEVEGEAEPKSFITFKKDSAFSVVKGTEEIRVGRFNLEVMLHGTSFQDINQEKEAKPLGLVEILNMLARIEKQVTKKADENGVELPASIKHQLTSMTNVVKSFGEQKAAAMTDGSDQTHTLN